MMTVKEVWQGETCSINPEEEKYILSDVFLNEKASKLFLEGCSCNTTGTPENANATEKAILKFLNKLD